MTYTMKHCKNTFAPCKIAYRTVVQTTSRFFTKSNITGSCYKSPMQLVHFIYSHDPSPSLEQKNSPQTSNPAVPPPVYALPILQNTSQSPLTAPVILPLSHQQSSNKSGTFRIMGTDNRKKIALS